MSEVINIKFKNRGKCYFFSPNGLQIKSGDKVVVETAKGLELADCCVGNHEVADTAVVQPLRPVVRLATTDDLRVEEINKKREKEAFDICRQKIQEHGLDMKLVDVECNFEGSKTTFFFTSDGRVDFRELVKDLAGIFRNRIELRQIGVRDEAKMVGGIAICGRPYCCGQFLDDFQPVSTKMAKIQSLSLNPTKISGSCGRLMCCLRYEQEAYEELNKKVPRQGAFVETKDGYGTAVSVNLLRQTVKVRLDDDKDDSLHLYKANELAAVPGGRPRDGEQPPHVLHYVPEAEEEEEKEDEWALPELFAQNVPEEAEESGEQDKKRPRRRRRGKGKGGASEESENAEKPAKQEKPVRAEKRVKVEKAEKGEKSAKKPADKPVQGQGRRGHAHVKPVKIEAKAPEAAAAKAAEGEAKAAKPKKRRYPHYRGKPKNNGGAQS